MRDHVPPDRYRIKVLKIDDTTSKTGKRMWTGSYKISAGEHMGANLGDNFVLVDNNNAPSKMGLGRLHQLLLCLGLPVKEAIVNLDLDRLSDLECEVDVVDEHFTDNSGNDRLTSNIRGYFALAKPANGVVQAADVPMMTGQPDLPSEPAPAEEAAAPVAEEPAEVSAVEAAKVEEEIEDLFR
jgi:hypothetical protein